MSCCASSSDIAAMLCAWLVAACGQQSHRSYQARPLDDLEDQSLEKDKVDQHSGSDEGLPSYLI